MDEQSHLMGNADQISLMAPSLDTNPAKDWFLVLVLVVLFLLCIVVSVYILVNFQHPEDRNQAYAPKAVVVLSLTLAMMSVLLLPLDIANRASCDEGVAYSECTFTLPMRALWFALYMAMFGILVLILPFMLFFYESDTEESMKSRLQTAIMYEVGTIVIVGLIVGLTYGLAGFLELKADLLDSGLGSMEELDGLESCFSLSGNATSSAENLVRWSIIMAPFNCNALRNNNPETNLRVRPSLPAYIIALSALVGWVLFIFYGGIGLSALPIDALRSFMTRPRKAITRSQYIQGAKQIGKRAKELKQRARTLREEERSKGKTRQTRREAKSLERELVQLEEDDRVLREGYPQGEDPSAIWIATVVGYYLQLAVGILGTSTSLLWVVHLVLYLFTDQPLHPFLNDMLIKLDRAFPLFGTAAFAIFSLHLVFCTIKGNFVVGTTFTLVNIHPMRLGNTFMSSFLFNIGLILLADFAVVQLCAQAFSLYANETTVNSIFSTTLQNVRGIGKVFETRAFIYAIFGLAILGIPTSFFRTMQHRAQKKGTNEDLVTRA